MAENQRLLAVLIDADNVQPALIEEIMKAIEKHGKPIDSRIYGDFSRDALKSWHTIAPKYNIKIEHAYHASSGKNATDIALVIDAMDILRDNKVEGFCIVSSDSDFTHLARRIKREGLHTIGIGNRSPTLRDVYEDFIPMESLRSAPAPTPVNKAKVAAPQMENAPPTAKSITPEPPPNLDITDDSLLWVLRNAFEHPSIMKDQRGWVTLPDLRAAIEAQDSDALQVEYKQMPNLVKRVKQLAASYPAVIKIEEQQGSKPLIHVVHINTELAKFRESYRYAILVEKALNENGWLALSSFGGTIKRLHPTFDYLMYKGIKCSGLKAVVERMKTDHPSVVEMKALGAGDHPYIRIK